MAGSGIWLDDATFLQTQGQIWAQQQTQNVHAGVSWAQQAMQDALKPVQDSMARLQQMVPQVPTTPAAPVAPPPTPIAPPIEPTPPMPAPAPPVPIGGTPVATPTPAPGDLTGGIAPAPTPTLPAAVPPPPPAPSMADVGQNWAQQQIQNLLNPSAPSSTAPATPAPSPDLAPPSPDSAALPLPSQAQSGVPPATPATTPGAPAGPQPNAPGDLIDQTRKAAVAAGIDPDIFSRQINQESGFNPNAGSPAGAQGIAQFMPDTARGLGIDPSDPGQALPAAANLMRSYLSKYGGDWGKALAAYNAGPGNVDKYGGIPPFEETQTYVKNILGGAKDLAQQGLTAVNTAVQGVQSAVATRASQFGLGLSSGDAMAFCGPTAAIAFAQTYGRNPTVAEAKQLAQQVGWDPNQGMAGVGSEVSLLKTMGVDAHATSGVDWSQVGRDASGGNPVIIDTPGHYYYVDGYNADTGQLHVGTSGTDLKGGSEWMTPDQINAMPQSHGLARAAIFADHPLAQQDGLAQSSSRSLTMGTNQPATPDVGQVLGATPLPFVGMSANDITSLLGQNAQQLQTGRDIVGGLLSPDSSVSRPLRAKADSILQAVQDVGSQATQAGQDLLQQGQQALQQAPQTIGDILQQNALTSQGIPNIGGNLLEGAGQLGQNLSVQNMAANPLMPSNILSGLEQGLGQNVVGPAINALLPGGALEQGRQALGGAIAGSMPDMPVLGGLTQAAGGMLAAPSVIEQMQTMQELSQKYAPGGLFPDPSKMTPEDAERWNSATMAIAGTVGPPETHGRAGVPPPPPPGSAARMDWLLDRGQWAPPPPPDPVTWGQRIASSHTAGSISGIATVDKVALNSILNPVWSGITRTGADVLGGVTGLAPGLSRAEAFGRAGGAMHGALAGLQSSGDAIMQGLRDVYNNPNAIANRSTNPIDIAYGRVTQTPAAIHSMFQTFGANLIRDMEMGRMAGQEAASRGLSGSAWVDEYARQMANPRPEWADAANGVAKRAVLRGDLGTLGSMFANLAGQGAGTGPAQGARSVLGNILFPVFKVGMNALTQGVEKSPLGAIGTGIDVARATTPLGRVLGEGPYAGGAFEHPVSSAVTPLSERVTNNIVGTAVTAWLATQAAQGNITGNGPTDPGQRQVLEAQGWQANSIKTPMGYVSYQGTPLEVSLGLVGDYADAFTRPQSKLELAQPLRDTMAERLFANTVNMLASRTGLPTLAQVSDLISGAAADPAKAMLQGGASLVGNIAGSYVPMSGALRSVAQMTDPMMRQPAQGDVGQAIEANLPVLRQQVPPRVDVLGQQVANPQAGLGVLLPSRLGAGEESPIAAAMGRTGVAPSAVPATIPYGPANEIRLTPAERTAYEQYRGQIIQQGADQLVRSPGFQQMPDYAQRAALQNVAAAASEAAGRMVLRDIGPSGVARMVPTGVLAPVQGYQPGGLGDQYLSQATMLRNQAQHAALMQSLMGGQTGLQALMAANARA